MLNWAIVKGKARADSSLDEGGGRRTGREGKKGAKADLCGWLGALEPGDSHSKDANL